MLSAIWAAFIIAAVIYATLTGHLGEVGAAISSGSSQAIILLTEIAGLMCFWSGLMEILRQAGLAEKMAYRLRPLLRPLFGKAAQDHQAMEAVSANISANLLGLSNAATPLGLKAVDRLYTLEGRRGAPDSVLTLITLNTTSIQLIPSTIAAIRSGCGAKMPFDIMPAVWGASVTSVAVVLLSGRLLRHLMPEKNI